MKDAAFKISGMIVDSTSKRGIPDLKIEAWDKDLVFNDLVGSAVTTKKGTFTIKFNASYFREIFMDRRPDLFFKVFKKGILIKSTEDSVLWNSAAGETKVAIEVDILHPPGPPAYIMSVSGRITHPDDTPIPDLTIKAFDKNPGKETGLGTCITDKQGRYRISYTDKQLGAKGKKRADLLVKVFKTGETKEPIAASALILNALPEETVDLRVIDDSIVKPPVFRLPAEKLLPELKNIRLTDLTENDTAVLANKTGLDRREVNDLVAAEHHRKTTGIATEVFYGLFRREMPTSLPALLGKGKQALKNALTASADAGIIDPGLKDRADEVVDNLMDKLADESFKEDNNAFLRGMLDMAGLPENNQKVFFRAYVKNEKPTDQFWEELRERDEFGETGVAKMQFAIQLGAVTGSNLSLVRALGEREDINEIRDLARLDRDQWQELVDNADIPGTITDKAAYARGIADMVEDAYPTAVLAHQMEKHNRQPEAAAFLLENPGFDLNRDNTAAYIRENGIEAGPALREELESLQRVYRFAPRYEKHKTAAVLRENGLRSAHAVKKMGGSAFVNRFGKALGGAESARQVYNGAANTASMSILMWSKYVKSINSAGTYAVNSPNLYLGGLTEGNPDLETLFGSIDFCDCRHCRSVLSPAAYLADLLVFLESTENKKGFVELEKRRPDIAHILLSCINTNTVMPYIDLVNEVLENVTAPPPPGNVPQTSWTAAELKAHPEHINRDAYNLLKEKIYPWNFNLWREEARLYLELVGVPRYLLMEIFSKGATPGKIDIACEQLNITLKDYDVLAAGNNNEVYKYYGLQGISQMTTLQEVRTLFKFALLTYEELLELLESTYINPAGKEIDYGVTPCSLENAVIGLDNDEFAKLRRFRLLLKKTGWTKIGLDRALTAFNVTVIDDNLIIALSYIQRLREQVKASADTMLSWWSPLDTADYEEESSLYARLFLNETIVNLIEKTKEEYPAMEADIFRLNNSKDELAHIGETMVQPGYKPLILKALDIDEDDLELLIDEEMGGDDALNLAALSFVYRVVSFCEALRITVPQYLSLRALTGQTPLKSLTVDAVPEDTFNFFAVFDRIKVSGFDIETLDYLLRHIYEENSSIVPPEEDITDLLETMQTGLQEQLDAEAAEADIKNYLVQTTAGQFEIESEAMASLLETHLPHPGDTTKPAIEFFLETDFLDAAAASSTKTYFNDLFVRLFKIAVIIRTQAIRAEELEFLFDKAPAIGWLNFMDLPLSTGSPLQVEPLLRLAETYRLQDTFAGDTFSIFQVLEEAETLDSAGFDAFITSLSKNTGWKKEDIQFLAGAGGYNFTFPQYTDEKWLVQLAGAFKQLHKIKTSAQQVWSWNTADITFTRAAAIKNTVKGNFYIKKWQELAPPLRNLLREQQRDILQAYLLTADHNDQFENADDLYSHYLMDSEMAPCFMTSRIKLAISSIQLFVQRIMLGLEPALSFDRDNTDQWKWRKNYRVWEANRKIFIYPENWIEPELRDDKSPFFKELEEELLQDDIDAHSAERVYLNYLNKLNEVANLEIAGMYNDEELDILHVFARTKGDPHIYFYRRWEDECWSAWEKVDLEIEGDHLLPVVYNRRLFLFWPKFIEKAIENASDLVVDSTKTTFAGQKPDKYLEIQMCWSTYRDGRWAAKKISRDHVKDKNLRTKIGSFGKNMLTFRTHITPGTNILLIGILYSLYGFDPGAGNPTPTGWESYLMTGHVIPGFQLNACSGELEIWMPQWESSNPAVHFTRPKGNAVHFMKFINSISEPGDHLLEVIAKREKPHFQFHLDTILGGSTGSGMEPKAQVITPKVLDYKITPLHQVPFFLAEYPFFYEDLKRAFFIVPEDVYRRRYRLQAIDTSRLTAAHLDKPSDAASRFSIIPAAGGITTGVLNRKTARAGSAGSAGSAKPVLSDTGLTVVPGVIKPSPVISAEAAVFAPTAETWTGKKYTFWTFYHPYVCLFIKQLNRYGIDGLLDPGCADPGDPDAEGLKLQKISDE
ncbi:MAG: hypothetical protein GY950_34900, partial [bacterium]|nr:hypothetical protein [bacterium]